MAPTTIRTAEYDAIVVLGCLLRPSGELGPAAQRRAFAGRDQFFAGRAPLIVASGGRKWGAHAEALSLRAALTAEGVPPEAILPELLSLTTFENAVYSAALLSDRLGKAHPKVLIATCSWHLPRALENFRRVGCLADGAGAEPPPGPWLRDLYRTVHELGSTRLDRRSAARAGGGFPGYHAHLLGSERS